MKLEPKATLENFLEISKAFQELVFKSSACYCFKTYTSIIFEAKLDERISKAQKAFHENRDVVDDASETFCKLSHESFP